MHTAHHAETSGWLRWRTAIVLLVFLAIAAFVLITLGFLLQWPTVVTFLMFPVLVVMYIRLAQRQSPEFHVLDSHPHWSETLKAGGQATLLVSFDPNCHGPEGVGLQHKLVRITAGDLQTPLAQLVLAATVVDDPKAGPAGKNSPEP